MPDDSPRARLVERLCCYALFALCLSLHLWSATRDFTEPLGGFHDFRKTQTAISTYYQIKEGFSFDYATPVLGAPWSIPMEFPLYQWIVAGLTRASGMDLDQAGRLVALLFFYLGLPAVYLLSNRGTDRPDVRVTTPWRGLVPLCLLFVAPTYIYWSSTFMIESLALCCSLWFLWFFVRWRDAAQGWTLGLATLCGLLAGLVKITTFLVFASPVGCLLVWDLWGELRHRAHAPRIWRILIGYGVALGLPLAAVAAWTFHADALKAQNPMAEFLQSAQLTEWNFGTLSQRLSPRFWLRIGQTLKDFGIGSWLLLPLLAPGLWNKHYRGLSLLCLAGFLTGPLIFANLYFVHDYYHYATILFALLALSLGAQALLDAEKTRWLGLVLLAAALFFPYRSYLQTYYLDQVKDKSLPAYCLFLRAVTDPDDVLLVYDEDWNSFTPYYAQRRAIMNRSNWPLGHPKFMRSIELTGKEHIVALLKEAADQQLNAFFGFNATPAMPNLYLRADVHYKAFSRMFGVDVSQSSSSMPLMATPHAGRFRLLCAPPGRVVAPLPAGAAAVSFSFGLIEAVGPVRFSVGHVDVNGENYTRLYEKILNPALSERDLAVQQAAVHIDELGSGALILENAALDENAPGPIPAYWSDVRLR